ncbi:MAG: transcription antitermination protein NusB [Flavobacteriales bacterium]
MLTRRCIRARVLESLYAYEKSGDTDYFQAERQMFCAVESTRDLYFLLLTFLSELQRVALNRIALRGKKQLPCDADLNPNMKFVSNHFFKSLSKSKEIGEFERKNQQWCWHMHPEITSRILKGICESLVYETHMAEPAQCVAQDLRFICDIFVEFIAADRSLQELFEDISPYWYANQAIANSMVVKTIESSRQKLCLSSVFRNEADRQFMKALFRETIRGKGEYRTHLVKNFKNWDPDRIAAVDFLIMEMAVSEFLRFPTIPEKVTLNEYIEVANEYATPKSKVFINGVLDKVLKQLNDSKKIKKTGRGLI